MHRSTRLVAIMAVTLFIQPASSHGARYDSGVVDVPIPDDETSWAVSSVSVPDTGAVGRLRVELGIDHTYVSDLTVRLTSPDGTMIDLVADRGGSGDDFGEVEPGSCGPKLAQLHPEANPTMWQYVEPPFTNTQMSTTGSLAAFTGRERAGTWQLSVLDDSEGSSGSIVCWRLLVDDPQRTPVAAQKVIGVGRTLPTSIGPFRLHGAPDFSRAVEAFGMSSQMRMSSRTWSAWGIVGTFENFGGHAEKNLQFATVRGRGWRTSHGLKIGDPVRRIRALYPRAERHGRAWWLRKRYMRYGTDGWRPTVSATIVNGRVAAFKLEVYAAGD